MNPKELTVERLAQVIQVGESELWSMARDMGKWFHPSREQLMKNGKSRLISPPKRVTKLRLRRLHRFLMREFVPNKIAHGGVRSKSCFTSARTHLGSSVVATRDLKDCYPSITIDSLNAQLIRMGFRRDVSWLLSHMFTLNGVVPQGSPISSDALNLLLRVVDHHISTSAGRVRASVTRVYDDVVVSARTKRDALRVVDRLEREVKPLGLSINPRKSRVMVRDKPMLVHGLLVNSPRGTRIRPDQAQQSLSVASQYVRACRSIQAENFESVAYKRERLFGFMCHCEQAEFGPATHLRRLLTQGDRIVSVRLRSLGLLPEDGRWWLRAPSNNVAKKISERWKKLA